MKVQINNITINDLESFNVNDCELYLLFNTSNKEYIDSVWRLFNYKGACGNSYILIQMNTQNLKIEVL